MKKLLFVFAFAFQGASYAATLTGQRRRLHRDRGSRVGWHARLGSVTRLPPQIQSDLECHDHR